MIALAAVVLSLALVPLIGGRFSGLVHLRLRYEAVMVVLFVIQGVLRGRIIGVDEASEWALAAWGGVCLALVFILMPSRGVPGVGVLIGGLASNLWVTLLNGGMPYATPSGEAASVATSFYHAANSATSFVWLGDVLPDPTGRFLVSLGDLLLLVGFTAVVLHGSTLSAIAREQHVGAARPPVD